ncbi:unnamed protein product [Ambrosiozyma monospora]|uniref:Unnamed protein product n=1 Tax=Ambrosiozyma monospora TaxID=43982 RepID=A0ACB5TYL2_AMBMO|nr:unnamed protein product [Ambrosiozyma monospora]
MTTAVPLIYCFPEFSGVAEAVADHILAAQNYALYNDYNKKVPTLSNTTSNSFSSNTNLPRSNSHHHSASVSKSRKEKRLQEKQENRRFKIGLSGGSLIQVLEEGLLKRDDIEWNKWDVYFADERLVPFDSKDSNYGKAKRKIFDKIPAGKGRPNVFPIDISLMNDPQECADQYEKTLIKGFASKDSVKLPIFDLILLGCAPDGHMLLLAHKREYH